MNHPVYIYKFQFKNQFINFKNLYQLFCTQKGRGVAENKCRIHNEFPFTAGEEDRKHFLISFYGGNA